MFEIHVSDTEVQGGTVAVSWCVDKALLDEMAAKGVRDPHVLLVAAPLEGHRHAARESRKVVPLRDLMTYLDFRASGRCRLFGFVLDGHIRKLRSVHEAREKRGYESWVVDYHHGENHDETVPREEWVARHAPVAQASVDVAVPKECFAKEPSAWEKRWVNLAFSSPPIDQCDFRRRRLFAYTIQAVWFVVLMAIRSVAALVLALAGMRKIGWSALTSPLSVRTEEMWNDTDGTVFVTRKTESWVRYLGLAFMPYVAVPAALVAYYYTPYGAFGSIAAGLGLAVGGLAALIVAFLAIGAVVSKIAYRYEHPDQPPPEWYLAEEEMRHLVCNGVRRTSVGDLPKGRRTIRLRFQDLKAKVCRPFSA